MYPRAVVSDRQSLLGVYSYDDLRVMGENTVSMMKNAINAFVQ